MDLETLNIEARERLAKLVRLSVGELNVTDIAFIQARRDYLTEAQKDKFSSILTEANIERFQKEALEEEQKRDARLSAEAVVKEMPVIDEEPKEKKAKAKKE